MPTPNTHHCGWIFNAADKYCPGCGERLFKSTREYGEIMAEIETIKKFTMDKPFPALAAISMMLTNILAWAAGEANTRPIELLNQMEKMAERFPGGWGKNPPSDHGQ